MCSSDLPDGTRSAHRQNVLGPHCMIEGPDTQLHGVGNQGHWIFDGQDFELTGRKLLKFDGTSPGFWDLIWTDASLSSNNYPGKTNSDLVWMLRDDTAQQVWIVIPFCNATLGYGKGTDTVILKYGVQTGGYTRSVFLAQTFTAGCYIPRDGDAPELRILAQITGTYQLARYGYKATANAVPALPIGTPVFSVTRMPAGPESIAIVTWMDFTVGWVTTGMVFTVSLSVDGRVAETVKLTIDDTAPAAPAAGDVWLQTFAVAAPAALFMWTGTAWFPLVGGRQQAKRATIPLPFTASPGTRFTATVTQLSSTGRYQIEALTFDAQGGARDTAP